MFRFYFHLLILMAERKIPNRLSSETKVIRLIKANMISPKNANEPLNTKKNLLKLKSQFEPVESKNSSVSNSDSENEEEGKPKVALISQEDIDAQSN
jgi:hypothetical protein